MSADTDWNGPHWNFSLSVYGQAGVQESCLLLQDRYGVDINVLLVTLYFVAHGHLRCDEAVVRTADEEVRALRDGLVAPLRELRRAMKSNRNATFPRESESVRNSIKVAELGAEQLEQALLAEHFGRSAIRAKPATGAADGLHRASETVVAFYSARMSPRPVLDSDATLAVGHLRDGVIAALAPVPAESRAGA